MMGQIKVITAIALTAAFVQACIMEDRSNCPAYLTLDFSDTPEEVSEIHLLLEDLSGNLFRDTLSKNEFKTLYEIPVRRGDIHIAAFGNVDRMVFDHGYRVQENEDADSLYTCFMDKACDGDLSFAYIQVLKNYIGLHIRVIGEHSDSLGIIVESSSAGYDLSGNILDGTFRHCPTAIHLPSGANSYFDFFSKITRQKDSNLFLTVRKTSGKTLVSINLFPYLKEAGIDMNDESLKDLYITLDIALSCISLSPEGWNSTDHTEILF